MSVTSSVMPSPSPSVSSPAARRRVAVIGGGIAGLTAALALAERGAAVELIERSAEPYADACSRMAGGMIAPWVEQARGEPYIAAIGLEALEYYAARVPGMVRLGSIVVASPGDRGALDRFAAMTEAYEKIDGRRLGELEPDLDSRFPAALFFPREGHLDPRTALAALYQALRDRGATIRLGVDGTDADANPDIDADTVVDCRGIAARDRLADLRGVKGEMLVLRNPEIAIQRAVRLLHPRFPVYIVPRGDGVYMIGATMIESDERNRISARSLAELIGSAMTLHPGFAEAEVLETGAEARPSLPDNLPHIRRSGRTVFVNGLYRHGFLAAPAMGRMAAAVVLDNAYFPEVMDEVDDQR
jgi:glycine oxidase